MAQGHWQIVKEARAVNACTVEWRPSTLDDVPAHGHRRGRPGGRTHWSGLYGVDVKEVGGRFLVIEVNDNPTIDPG